MDTLPDSPGDIKAAIATWQRFINNPVRSSRDQGVRREHAQKQIARLKSQLANAENMTAGDLIRRMGGEHGGPAQAAEALRNAGIKGIRYRDAGSRATAPTYKGQPFSQARNTSFGGTGQDEAVGAVLKTMEREGLSAAEAIKKWKADIAADAASGRQPDAEAMLLSLNKLKPKDFQAPKETRNFVVFDDSMLEIIRKYGLVLPGAAGAAGAAQAITDPGALGAEEAGGA